MNEPYNCDDNEEDKNNYGTNQLGLCEVTKHRVLLCEIPPTAKVEWERPRKQKEPPQGRSLAARRVNAGHNCTPRY